MSSVVDASAPIRANGTAGAALSIPAPKSSSKRGSKPPQKPRQSKKKTGSSPQTPAKKTKVPEFDPEFRKKHFGELPQDRLDELQSAKVLPRVPKSKNLKGVAHYNDKLAAQLKTRAFIDQGNYAGEPIDPHTKVVGKRLIWTSFAINIVLAAIKLAAFILSGSLAVFASFLHSVLDVLTTTILFATERLTAKDDPYKYPVGRKRMEALAVISFSAGMFAATAQVIVVSIESLVEYDKIEVDPDLATYIIVSLTIIIKFILYLLCRRLHAPALQALAIDHRNDTLSNVVSLATLLAGFYWEKGSDPVGAMIIAIFIMSTWAYSGVKLFLRASGKTARPAFLSRVTYIAFTHDPRIVGIDTVRAYGVSERYNVECDILLPFNMALKDTHDIGESLQQKLEQLPEVERAFVHVDYDAHHKAIEEHPSPLKKNPMELTEDEKHPEGTTDSEEEKPKRKKKKRAEKEHLLKEDDEVVVRIDDSDTEAVNAEEDVQVSSSAQPRHSKEKDQEEADAK